MKNWIKKLFGKSFDFFNHCNTCFKYSILPNMVKLYEEGVIEKEAFFNKEYYKNFLIKLYGKKAKPFAEDILIEHAKVKNLGSLELYVLKLPNSGEPGQTEHVAIIIDEPLKTCYIFHMEITVNGNFMTCEWDAKEKKLFNYGEVKDKKEFVLKIINLANVIEPEKDSEKKKIISPTDNYDSLDLKHRLADKIGVKYENLDFYMETFEQMVSDEMNGIDTSGLPSGIQDVDEWNRYLQWEIEQSMKRSSKKDLQDIDKLFEIYLNRERGRMN